MNTLKQCLWLVVMAFSIVISFSGIGLLLGLPLGYLSWRGFRANAPKRVVMS